MNKKGKGFLGVLIMLFFCCLFSASVVRGASNETTITITPSIFDNPDFCLVDPGDVRNGTVTVSNKSDKEITLYAYLRDFKAEAEDESGVARLIVPGTEEGNYISSWINISTDGVTIPAGGERNMPFSINVPENTGPGGYYGAIVFGTEAPKLKPGEAETGAAIGISQQAASLILLQIKGQADERANIREFKTDKRFYSTPFEVAFSSKVENLGNVHVKPRGVIEIRNMFGKKVTSLMVNDKANNVLPKSIRQFTNTWKDSFGFGKYEAELALSYGTTPEQGGEGKKTMTMFWYFWVFPAKILISLAFSLVVVIIMFFVFLRLYRRMAVKRAMEQMGMKGRPLPVRKEKEPATVDKEYVLTFSIIAAIVVLVIAVLYFLLF